MFRILEQMFQLALPLLEKTVAFEYPAGEGLSAFDENPAYHRWTERYEYLGTLGDDGSLDDWRRFLVEQRSRKAAKTQAIECARSERAVLKVQERAELSSVPAVAESQVKSIWAGRRLKVIIKAVNYVLHPGQDYEGNWHVAGMPHDRIVASAFYFYGDDTRLQNAAIHLRRRRDYSDFPQVELRVESLVSRVGNEEVINNPSEYGSDMVLEFISASIDVGFIPITRDGEKTGTGRMVTFPNWMQHRITLRNPADASDPSVFKLLCFYLVDDGNGPYLREGFDPREQPGITSLENDDLVVPTTQDISPQAQACNLPTIGFLLRVAFRQAVNRAIPYELVKIVLEIIRKSGAQITREETEKRRRSFMEERSQTLAEENQWWEDEWELDHDPEWYDSH